MAVTILGLSNLMIKLEMMGGNVMAALEKAVTVTTESAKASARANIHNRTGDLGRSIEENSRVEHSLGKVTGVVAANMPYAIYVEMGTHNDDGSQRNPPYPYMMPALNENKALFETLAEKELREAIRRTAGGG